MMIWKRIKKPDEQAEKKLKEEIESEGGLEKKDFSAMILAAFVTVYPVCLLVLAALGALGLWVFGGFR